MYFLVDFENVRNGGLRGVYYLEESDYLTIFYSNDATDVKTDTWRILKDRVAISIHVN